MEISNIIGYASLLPIGVLSAVLAASLYRRYSLQSLLFLFFFVICFTTAGFLEIIGDFMAREILSQLLTAESPLYLITWVFRFISFPFSILAAYLFVLMVLALAGKKISPGFKIAFFSLQISMIIIWVLVGPGINPDHKIVLRNLQLVFTGINMIMFIIFLFLLVKYWIHKSEKSWQRGIENFALLYILALTIYFVTASLIGIVGWACTVGPILLFSLHLPPLAYMHHFLENHTSQRLLHPIKQERITVLLNQYNISDREAQILLLLLNGKSYRDIENELFISMKTVKSHIYNIYRKAKVKSRWQLLNIFSK